MSRAFFLDRSNRRLIWGRETEKLTRPESDYDAQYTVRKPLDIKPHRISEKIRSPLPPTAFCDS